LAEAYGKLPLSFEINKGQTDSQVKFLSRGSGYSLFLTGNEAVLSLKKSGVRSQKSVALPFRAARQGSADLMSESAAFPALLPTTEQFKDSFAPRSDAPVPDPESRAPAVLRMKLVGANGRANVTGLEELPGKSNYFIGSDPKKWHTNVPNYVRVKYANVYPGVDLVYYGNQGKLEYDFVVQPGADPHSIELAIKSDEQVVSRQKAVGSESNVEPGLAPATVLPRQRQRGQDVPATAGETPALRVNGNGDLVVGTEDGEIVFHKPVVYQPATYNERRTTNSGGRDLVEGQYVLRGHNRIAFQLAEYDRHRPVVIDPTLAYSTYLGGSDGGDGGYGIAVDASGNACVTGITQSSDFPVSPGALQTAFGGDRDAFVSKLNAVGSALIYSTYLGGTGDDRAFAIALDAAGNAYITGTTHSSNFPTTPGAFQTTSHFYDGFVSKLNASGSDLIYSTYLGGSSSDGGSGIAVDASGNVYVSGGTSSSDFPTTPGAFQTTYAGGSNDGFVSKLNAAGSALIYSTYLGGTGADSASAIALDAAGNAYVIGSTLSSNFPTTPGAFQTTYPGGEDSFVSKLNANGSALLYSTYLGEGDGFGITIDAAGNAYATGNAGLGFPTTPGAFQTTCCSAFITKLNAGGSALLYSTYLGGSNFDQGYGIAVDASGNAYVTGTTTSSDFPTTPDAFQTAGGKGDVFVSKLNANGSALLYSTYLGGTSADFANAIAADAARNAYVTGETVSSDFPTTPGAFQTTGGGYCFGSPCSDAFIVKFSFPTGPGLALSPPSLTFAPQAVGSTSATQKARLSNDGTLALSITSIVASGDFAQTNDCPVSPGTVPPAGLCTLTVSFTPTATGIRTGAVTITDNAAGSPHQLPLTGTGGVPAVSLTPASLTFASQAIGTTSPAQTATLKNTGSGPLAISSITTAGDFGQTNKCGSMVNAGASCTLSVTFKPTATGTRTGTITITDDAAGTPHTLSLTGTGFNGGPVVSLTPSSLTFAAQMVGTFSPAQSATLKNTGGTALKIISIGRSGDFYEGNNCPATLAAGSSCTVRVTFTPSSAGPRPGAVTIADNAPGSPHKLPLSGTGSGTGSIVLMLSPASLSFGSVAVGATSASQTVTLTNNGTVAASFLEPFGFATTGANWSDFHKNPHCGTSLAPGKSCTVSVFFKPLATGTRTGFFLVRQGAASQQIPLSGTCTP
jgi:hypothetical protein